MNNITGDNQQMENTDRRQRIEYFVTNGRGFDREEIPQHAKDTYLGLLMALGTMEINCGKYAAETCQRIQERCNRILKIFKDADIPIRMLPDRDDFNVFYGGIMGYEPKKKEGKQRAEFFGNPLLSYLNATRQFSVPEDDIKSKEPSVSSIDQLLKKYQNKLIDEKAERKLKERGGTDKAQGMSAGFGLFFDDLDGNSNPRSFDIMKHVIINEGLKNGTVKKEDPRSDVPDGGSAPTICPRGNLFISLFPLFRSYNPPSSNQWKTKERKKKNETVAPRGSRPSSPTLMDDLREIMKRKQDNKQ